MIQLPVIYTFQSGIPMLPDLDKLAAGFQVSLNHPQVIDSFGQITDVYGLLVISIVSLLAEIPNNTARTIKHREFDSPQSLQPVKYIQLVTDRVWIDAVINPLAI